MEYSRDDKVYTLMLLTVQTGQEVVDTVIDMPYNRRSGKIFKNETIIGIWDRTS